MLLIQENLTIRNAVFSDAVQLREWWANGEIMASSGFPNGLDTKLDELQNRLINATDKLRIFMIELDGEPIGEMNYKTVSHSNTHSSSHSNTKTAEIGIKICVADKQNKGLGTKILSIFIDALFKHHNFQQIILDTNVKNERAKHIYQKLGFTIVRINENAWQNQLGEMQSSIDFCLRREDWAYSGSYHYVRPKPPAPPDCR